MSDQSTPRQWLTSLRWLAALATTLTGLPAAAQTLPTNSSTAVCPSPEAIAPSHLYGLWQLTLESPEAPTGDGELVFERHPEYPGSVRGTLSRQVAGRRVQAQVAGDVTDQGFQLEESADGVAIDALWSGEVVPASCGRTIRGERRVVEGRTTQESVAEHAFQLQKTVGWR